jgi:hypothetical protein
MASPARAISRVPQRTVPKAEDFGGAPWSARPITQPESTTPDCYTEELEMSERTCRAKPWLTPILLGILVAGGLLVGFPTAYAADNGPTVTGAICMQKVFGAPVSNSNRLNCTANDIRISRATSAVNADTGEATCVASGDPNAPSTFTLEGTFETIVTANARYDAGFFFRIDGGSNARGDGVNATGACSLSALDPTVEPALNLDGDTCGDLNAGTYELTFTIPNVACVDTDGDGFVNLPNCTSWHSNQGTACTVSDPFVVANAPGFRPDTKSKCVCDDTFQIPISIESPSGAVLKKATKAVVTYEVKVKNNSVTRTVKINSLVDDVYGDIADTSNANLLSTNCNTLIGDQLAPGATSDACTFTVQYDNPGTGGDVTDKVTSEIEDTVSATKINVDGSATINVNLNVTPTP